MDLRHPCRDHLPAVVTAVGRELPMGNCRISGRRWLSANDALLMGVPIIRIISRRRWTVDATYLRSSLIDVLSVLRRTTCPESITFNFVASSATLVRRAPPPPHIWKLFTR